MLYSQCDGQLRTTSETLYLVLEWFIACGVEVYQNFSVYCEWWWAAAGMEYWNGCVYHCTSWWNLASVEYRNVVCLLEVVLKYCEYGSLELFNWQWWSLRMVYSSCFYYAYRWSVTCMEYWNVFIMSDGEVLLVWNINGMVLLSVAGMDYQNSFGRGWWNAARMFSILWILSWWMNT